MVKVMSETLQSFSINHTDLHSNLGSDNFDISVLDSDRMGFTSYLGRPSETGFTSNHRPAIYYRPSLDHIDNPQFG